MFYVSRSNLEENHVLKMDNVILYIMIVVYTKLNINKLKTSDGSSTSFRRRHLILDKVR